MVFNKLLKLFETTKKLKEIKPVFNTPDVQQGLEYLNEKQQMYNAVEKNLTLIENFQSNSNELWTQGQENSETIKQMYERDIAELKILEETFQKQISQYSVVYKNYNDALLKAINTENNKYNGQNINTPNNSGYYVTKYGVAKWYSGEAWDKRDKSCDTGITKLSTNNLSDVGITRGPNMGIGEPCGLEGQNVKVVSDNNNLNGLTGYINEEGILHPYPNNNTQNTSGTCPTSSTNINSDIWNTFTKSTPMDFDTLCALGNVDIKEKTELIQINRDLMATANKIYEKIQTTRQHITSTNNQMDIESTYLDKQLEKYKHLFKKIKNIRKKEDTLTAMVEDSMFKYKSNNLQYIVWALLAGIALFLSIRHVRK